ncbi:transposon Tf2-9 polyprotein [Trichonephila clavipes]|nr:transposon Tf2-9 polyprotein [Trichonephila clavipes]
MRNPLLRGRVGYLCLKREVERTNRCEWLEQGIIRESCSDFSSPVVVCKKKDGTMRLCIDYRKLNKKIVKDRYPLPIIEEVLDKLGNGKNIHNA